MRRDKKLDSLKNKAEFDFIYKNAKRFFHKNFVLYALKLQTKSPHYKTQKILDLINERNAELYLGLSISKKIGKACVRNLIKRRVRAIVREYICEHICVSMNERVNEGFGSICLVFVAREGVVEADFATLKRDMLFGIKKLQVELHNPSTHNPNTRHVCNPNRKSFGPKSRNKSTHTPQ